MSLKLWISTGSSRKSLKWTPELIDWEALCERLLTVTRTAETQAEWDAMSPDQRSAVKDVGGYVGGRLEGERRKADAVKARQLLVLDADYAPSDFHDAVVDWAVPWACCAHSTHSHKADKPRYRLVIPLTREVTADEYEACARWISAEIGMEMFDDTTYEPSRLMYWPSCPSDGRFESWKQEGAICDPDLILAQYDDWHDTSSWPRSERAKRLLSEAGRKQGDPRTKPGVVGAFCRVYDVPAAIDKYLPTVYHEDCAGRYTYTAGTTSGGMILLDDGQFCRSYHSTDPASGKLINAFDLVRLHLYGSLDDDADEDTPINQLPSYQAMRALCRNDADVWLELGGSSADEDFGSGSAHELQSQGVGSDQDVSLEFRDFAWPTLRYTRSLGWCAWDGRRWEPDADSRARKTVMAFNDTILALARTENGDDAKAKLKRAVGLRSTGKINGLLINAQALLADTDDWDTDPWKLNTPAGIVDLKTGTMRPHDPAERMTAITRVAPDKSEPHLWMRFIGQATGGDKGLEDYLQQVLGMALVGKVYSEGMLIVTGSGGNGKSTLFGTCMQVLGSYAETIRPEILLARQNGGEVFGIECMRGKRLCIAGETDEHAGMSVSMMKRLTSRDAINANPKHKQPFNFTPSHTLILHTNHLPNIKQFDEGTKRRLAVAVFPHTPKPSEIIVDLMDQLVEKEGGAILQWMIDGAVMYWKQGCVLRVPESVKAHTKQYIDSNDWMNQFLADCCEVGEGKYCKGGELYGRYRAWCAETGERYPRRNRDFANELLSRGFERQKTMKCVEWSGLEVISEFMD